MSVDDELVQAFLEESRENLDQLDLDLVELERVPDDPELLARVFRTVHTVKGTCGFLGYGHLEGLSHAGEDLLAALRDGALILDQAITDSLLLLVDEIREVLSVVERTGTEPDDDHADVIMLLRSHLLRQTPTGPNTPGTLPPPAAPAQTVAPAPSPEETSVRIDVEVLDRLQDLVGELTLARLRVGDFIPDDGPLAHAFHQLTTTTRALQDSVMQARLQPLSTATDRLRRIVRDLATRAGKQVDLQIVGDEVTVDKAINEILRDPLVHLVRNAIDHGIERPEERVSKGKSAVARLAIEAAVIGGGVRIKITDDGRGINRRRLLDRATEAGLLSQQQAATLTDAEVTALLFLPGVSTASGVTNVSGRGVGMDVVRANLEQVGGSIDVWSQTDTGTTFTMNVPLTLAILPAIVVSCGGSRYVIPQADVQAIVNVGATDYHEVIRSIGQQRFLRHHEALLPLVDLSTYLGVPSEPTDCLEIVVIRRLERTYGLIVGSVGDSVEVVVKPLPMALRGLDCYAGVTVLSDGKPSLILEASAPATDAEIHQHTAPLPAAEAHISPEGTALLTLMVQGNRLAVPLTSVDRLIREASQEIERSSHDEVLQHRGAILPLIRVGVLLGLTPADRPEPELVTIVACASPLGRVGLIVDAVLDIAHADLSLAEAVDDACLVGRLVVDDKVADLLDLDALVREGLHSHAGSEWRP